MDCLRRRDILAEAAAMLMFWMDGIRMQRKLFRAGHGRGVDGVHPSRGRGDPSRANHPALSPQESR
jgi:hypothetical protein